MPQNRQNRPNCGRFQAQGNNLEKSRSWAEVDVPTKQKGHDYLANLKQQLTRSELNDRQSCFTKASGWIDRAPACGYDAVIVTSFKLYPPKKGIRVDAEVRSGFAFKDNEE